MRWLVPLVGLVLVLASVFALSIDYGSSKEYTLELNGSSRTLSVRINDIEENADTVVTVVSDELEDRVFCAPSPADVDGDRVDITCVVLPGSSVSGDIDFVAKDENGSSLDTTTLELTVVSKKTWYVASATARVGATISAGGYTIKVKQAKLFYAVLEVTGEGVYTAFLQEETNITPDFIVVYRGFDEDTGEVFLKFRSTVPVSVSASEQELYLVTPSVVYVGDNNVASVPVKTNCQGVEYRVGRTGEWEEVSLEDVPDLEFNAGSRVYFRCKESPSVASATDVKAPEVIVQEKVETKPDPEYCSATWAVTGCPSWAEAHGYVKVPAGYECKFVEKGGGGPDVRLILFGLLVLLIAAYVAHQKGYIEIPFLGRKSDEKPEEEAAEFE